MASPLPHTRRIPSSPSSSPLERRAQMYRENSHNSRSPERSSGAVLDGMFDVIAAPNAPPATTQSSSRQRVQVIPTSIQVPSSRSVLSEPSGSNNNGVEQTTNPLNPQPRQPPSMVHGKPPSLQAPPPEQPREEQPPIPERRPFGRRESTWRTLVHETEEETARLCFPEGFTTHLIPLCISVVALALTGAASWDCSYFIGAHIDFTGRHYGLWTLQDSTGKCQLWDVLFFAYDLGAPLIAARVFSMTAMLLGLSLSATMAQASQFHLASWGIGVALLILFMVSLSTTSIFNVWVVFWLFSYAILVLIIRFLFIHPVHRRISQRGAKIIASFFVFCGACCLLTLVVLKSDYCTCTNLTTERLDGRDPGQPCGSSGASSCQLGVAGYLMLAASMCYVTAAICCLRFGIQPEELKESPLRPAGMYAHYPQQSIVTRVRTKFDNVWGSGNRSAAGTTPTAALRAIGEDEEDDDEYFCEENQVDDKEVASNYTGSATGNQQQTETFQEEANGEIWDNDEDKVAQPSRRGSRRQQQSKNSNQREVLGWDHMEDTRGCCQKCCCDFRIVPRTRRERCLFWTFRSALVFGFVIYGLVIFMLVGSRRENTIAAKRPDTTPFFTMDAVCGYNPVDPNQPFETFVNREAAQARGWTVAHCGECGHCSNPHDIITYVETRKTIAKSSKECGPQVYLGTYEDVADCLEEKIGFTRPCTYCWADNMVNTGEKCLSTCLRTLFSGFMTDNNIPGAGDQGWMNQCLFCDEKRSGPAFVTCSGVARRRLGIVSEIERNPEEQCKRMDIDWVNVAWGDIGFAKQQQT